MRATGLSPLESAVECCPGGEQRAVQVEGVREIRVTGDVGPDVEGLGTLLDLDQPPQPVAQSALAADDTAAFGHQVSHGALQRAGEFFAASGEQLVHFLTSGHDRPPVADMHIEPARPARRLGADDTAEHETLGKRVPSKPVRSVYSGRALTDRE